MKKKELGGKAEARRTKMFKLCDGLYHSFVTGGNLKCSLTSILCTRISGRKIALEAAQ
jgi:hypothetical protein